MVFWTLGRSRENVRQSFTRRIATIKEILIRNIIESLPVGLIVINNRGSIITSNGAAANILGVSASALDNRVWGELFFEEAANDAFNQVILDVIEEKKIKFHQIVPYLRPDGEILTLSMTTSFVKDEAGAADIVVLIDDLTEIERLHDQERASLREKQRIQSERAESLRNLALAVAHQIRNPVAGIGGFALRLKRNAKPGTQMDQYLQFILDGSRRLEQVVEAVHSFTEVHDLKWQSVAAATLVKTLVDNFIAAQDEAAAVAWHLDLAQIQVNLDPLLFGDALTELLKNAAQALENGRGTITVRILKEPHGDGWRLEVQDTGRGIPASDLPFIQDPFFTTRADAVGMGLSRVRRIILEHGGSLTIESEPAKGTRATIQMPD